MLKPATITFQDATASLQDDYRRARPDFVQHSAKMAVAVLRHMETQQTRHCFVSLKKLTRGGTKKIISMFRRCAYPDTPQFLDFSGIVFEVANLGVVHDGNGLWFFRLDKSIAQRYTMTNEQLMEGLASILPETRFTPAPLSSHQPEAMVGGEDDEEDEPVPARKAVKPVDDEKLLARRRLANARMQRIAMRTTFDLDQMRQLLNDPAKNAYVWVHSAVWEYSDRDDSFDRVEVHAAEGKDRSNMLGYIDREVLLALMRDANLKMALAAFEGHAPSHMLYRADSEFFNSMVLPEGTAIVASDRKYLDREFKRNDMLQSMLNSAA